MRALPGLAYTAIAADGEYAAPGLCDRWKGVRSGAKLNKGESVPQGVGCNHGRVGVHEHTNYGVKCSLRAPAEAIGGPPARRDPSRYVTRGHRIGTRLHVDVHTHAQ